MVFSMNMWWLSSHDITISFGKTHLVGPNSINGACLNLLLPGRSTTKYHPDFKIEMSCRWLKMQDCINSGALAMELLQSCTKPSTRFVHAHLGNRLPRFRAIESLLFLTFKQTTCGFFSPFFYIELWGQKFATKIMLLKGTAPFNCQNITRIIRFPWTLKMWPHLISCQPSTLPLPPFPTLPLLFIESSLSVHPMKQVLDPFYC